MSDAPWDSSAARAAARFSLSDFLMTFSDDPLVPDDEFVAWRAATRWAGDLYQQRLAGAPAPRTRLVTDTGARPILNFASYNYLGFADHPAVIRAAREALAVYGVGSCGSPMISGMSDLHAALEARLSALVGREATMLFNSGLGLYYGTFSKAFAGIGGFASGDAAAIDYLRHYADAYGFSCALPPAIVAALLAVLDLVEVDPSPIARLEENARILRDGLRGLGVAIGASTTHVVPIIVGADRIRLYRLAAAMRERGLFIVPFDYPSVPIDGLRLRACVEIIAASLRACAAAGPRAHPRG